MKVILLEDVKNVGRKGEVVEVKDGYGRNFLLNRGKGILATAKSLEVLNTQKVNQQEEENYQKSQAEALAKKLETLKVEFELAVGAGGKVFGSISTKQVSDKIEADYGIIIDKRKFKDNGPFNNLGLNKAKVELFKGVEGIIIINILAKE